MKFTYINRGKDKKMLFYTINGIEKQDLAFELNQPSIKISDYIYIKYGIKIKDIVKVSNHKLLLKG